MVFVYLPHHAPFGRMSRPSAQAFCARWHGAYFIED